MSQRNVVSLAVLTSLCFGLSCADSIDVLEKQRCDNSVAYSTCTAEDKVRLCQEGRWAELPCGVDQVCVLGECKAKQPELLCTMRERRCWNGKLELCEPDQHPKLLTCASGELCRLDQCVAEAEAEDLCTESYQRCLGGKLERCELGQRAKIEACPASQICQNDVCVEAELCQSDSSTCNSEQLSVCEKGKRAVVTACSGTKYCFGDRCLDKPEEEYCRSRSERCEHGLWRRCLPRQMSTTVPCTGANECREGRCVDKESGRFLCMNTWQTCENQWLTTCVVDKPYEAVRCWDANHKYCNNTHQCLDKAPVPSPCTRTESSCTNQVLRICVAGQAPKLSPCSGKKHCVNNACVDNENIVMMTRAEKERAISHMLTPNDAGVKAWDCLEDALCDGAAAPEPAQVRGAAINMGGLWHTGKPHPMPNYWKDAYLNGQYEEQSQRWAQKVDFWGVLVELKGNSVRNMWVELRNMRLYVLLRGENTWRMLLDSNALDSLSFYGPDMAKNFSKGEGINFRSEGNKWSADFVGEPQQEALAEGPGRAVSLWNSWEKNAGQAPYLVSHFTAKARIELADLAIQAKDIEGVLLSAEARLSPKSQGALLGIRLGAEPKVLGDLKADGLRYYIGAGLSKIVQLNEAWQNIYMLNITGAPDTTYAGASQRLLSLERFYQSELPLPKL